MEICFAFPTYDGRLPVEASVALANSVYELRKAGVSVNMQWGAESALIDLCRSRLVKVFLEQTKSDKLFFIDSDIIFKPKDVMSLSYHSQKYPIVGAVYPVRKDPPKFYLRAKGEVLETNEDGLISVNGFGAGFVIIDRSVFEKMTPYINTINTDKDSDLQMYFDIRVRNNEYLGEDISFYTRWVEECAGSVYLDPGINLKHVGTKEFGYKFMDYINTNLEKVA